MCHADGKQRRKAEGKGIGESNDPGLTGGRAHDQLVRAQVIGEATCRGSRHDSYDSSRSENQADLLER